jgi:hypothetical protein
MASLGWKALRTEKCVMETDPFPASSVLFFVVISDKKL